jgi:hypothetical protein
MKKPEINTIHYYDWDLAWDYIKEKYNFNDMSAKDRNGKARYLWNHICDTHEIHNGKIFTLSNWELVYNDGQFLYMVPEWYRPILQAFIDEFGEIDKGCLTPGTKTVNFRASW